MNRLHHDRFPDGTTSHSTRLPKNGNQVAGYHPRPPAPEEQPLSSILWMKQLAIRLGCQRSQPSHWLSRKRARRQTRKAIIDPCGRGVQVDATREVYFNA